MKGIIFGLTGTILLEDEQILIEELEPHGVILFGRNCDNRQQIINLTKSIKEISPETKIFIDQEGGRVRRIKPPVGEKDFPSMEVFDRLYDESPKDAIEKWAHNFFEIMTELKCLGVDVTIAPVCDLRFPEASAVIGDRSFGSSVEKVVNLAKAALDGIHKAGGEGVIKHIPDHGRALKDSHHELPFVDASLDELEKTDFAVFKELTLCCPYAMTAHVVYKAIDPEDPATFSKHMIDYIRSKIGFKGIILTDALEMKALSKISMDLRAKAAYEAGCDIALYCTSHMGGVKESALNDLVNLS